MKTVALVCGTLFVLALRPAYAQIKAQPPSGPLTPPWDKGIQPISRDSYYNAIACGKQGGANPACVFWDRGVCRNDDFTLAFFTPYKMVAYEVWQAARKKQEPPMPNYAEAQRTRVTIGVTPVAGSKNAITSVTIRRGDRVLRPFAPSLEGGGGKFIFDFPAFAPTADITIELAGRTRSHSCLVEQAVLALFR